MAEQLHLAEEALCEEEEEHLPEKPATKLFKQKKGV